MARASKRPGQSTFLPGPALPGHHVQYDEARHAWIIDGVVIACSPMEYRCLRILLEHANSCVPYAQMLARLDEHMSGVYTEAPRERLRLAYFISRLRAKLWTLGLDIANVMSVGYILLATSADESDLSPPFELSSQDPSQRNH